MLLEIVKGTPVWVWPLLALLIFVGIRSAQDRSASIRLFYIYPLIGMITLTDVLSLNNPLVAWSGFLIGYTIGAVGGYWLQTRWLIRIEHHRVLLKGEWLTLIVLMTVFWTGFAAGVTNAINPGFINTTGFILQLTLIKGIAAGSFFGRAIRTLRFAYLHFSSSTANQNPA